MTESVQNPKRTLVLLSPFIVMAFGYLVAKVGGYYIGVWSWVPLLITIWLIMAFFVFYGTNKETRLKWLQPSKGKWGWAVLAILIGFIPLPLLVFHWNLLIPTEIWVSWLVFGLVNPWIEESYWRGLLMNTANNWEPWKVIGYTSILFAVSHPIMWGVNSVANFTVEVFASTLVMGVIWALVYYKTGSLRWVITSHILVDLFNLSIPIFLNLYTPPM